MRWRETKSSKKKSRETTRSPAKSQNSRNDSRLNLTSKLQDSLATNTILSSKNQVPDARSGSKDKKQLTINSVGNLKTASLKDGEKSSDNVENREDSKREDVIPVQPIATLHYD